MQRRLLEKCPLCKTHDADVAALQQRLLEETKARQGSDYEADRLLRRALADAAEIERLKKSLGLAQSSADKAAADGLKKDRDEIDRLRQQLTLVDTRAAAAVADALAQGDKDKEEIERLRQQLVATDATVVDLQSRLRVAMANAGDRAAADAQHQRDRDDLDRLQRELASCAAAKASANKALEAQRAQAAKDRADSDATVASLRRQLAEGGSKDAAELASLRKLMDEREKQSWSELSAMQRQLEDALSATQPQPQPQADVDVDALRRRIADLEKQRGLDLASITDLRKQLDALSRARASLEARAVADQATIDDLRRQLDQHLQKQVASDDADVKRLADLQEVNDTLLRFARERAFQEDVKRPLVRVALDLWGGDAKDYTEEQKEAARHDDGVARIYPRMKVGGHRHRHCHCHPHRHYPGFPF